MKVKDLCLIAAMAAIEMVVFTSFSFVLYLECITFTIILFAMTFTRKQAVFAAIVFTILNLSIQGVTPWSMMYCLIYPLYSFLIATLRPFFKQAFPMSCFPMCSFIFFKRAARSTSFYAHFQKSNPSLYSFRTTGIYPAGNRIRYLLFYLLQTCIQYIT